MTATNGRNGPRPLTVVISDVAPEAVTWLWPARIPFGKLAVVDGDPGLGKSTLALHIGAALTRGRPIAPGEEAAASASVLLLSAEDGLADTIRPRLAAADADLGRVIAMTEILERGEPRPVTLPGDVPHIERAVIAHQAKLVVIDPLMAFLGGGVDAHKDQDVRRALVPITKMAERTGAAVVIVRHIRKSGVGSAVYAGGGSIGIIGAARAGLLVARDPDDPDVRVLAVSKMNLAREPPALRYRLVDGGSGVAHLEWIAGPCSYRADELVVQAQADVPGALGEACDFLRRILAGGPVLVSELTKAARDEQIAEKTLKRARKKLGVQSHKGKGASKAWMVSLGPLAPMAHLSSTHFSQPEAGDEEGQEGQEGLEVHAGELGPQAEAAAHD